MAVTDEVSAVADLLVDVYMTRAGAEDARQIVASYVDEAADGAGQIVALACLVMKLAERAADAQTVYDIWDPQRRIVPDKIKRLSALVVDAGARWSEELKRL